MKAEICKNCDHWRKDKGPDTVIMKECSSPKFVELGDGGVLEIKDGLVYYDYESYSAGFTTGPYFGCIHFKEK